MSGGIHFHGGGSAPGAVPAQLPADVHGFVNRVADLARLDAALGDIERPGPDTVCVIAGTAGVGKTSLAVHWAHRARGRFPDGQLYVNLRGYDPGEPVSPAQALERFLETLGVAASAIPVELEARAALYRSLLAGRRMLVVLDNAATVGQVRPLLPGAGECLVLVTSRDRLSGLVARDGAHRITLDVFDEQAAVELLHTTTSGYRAGDDDGELGELAQLCARLPLALRIAAERAAARPRTPLGALIRDLRDESSLWEALSSQDDEEADAVRTVFAWSYRALSPEAARLFRLLGLHPGPEFSIHAAAALAAQPEREARRLLDLLVGAHLLEQTADDRFQFHDLLRAYALDQAAHQESPEDRQAALRRLLDWYLRAVNAALVNTNYLHLCFTLGPVNGEAELPSFTDHSAALRWYEVERANLVAATRAADQQGFDELAWQLPAVLGNFYDYRHPVDEWLESTRIGLQAARRAQHRLGEGRLLYSLGKARAQFQHAQEGVDLFRSALDIQRSIGDRPGEGRALTGLALAYLRLHALTEARTAAEEAVAVARSLGERPVEGFALELLAWALYELGELQDADGVIEQSVAIHRAGGHPANEVDALVTAIKVQRELGQVDKAFATAQHTLSLATKLDEHLIMAECFRQLGDMYELRGDHADALTSYQQAGNLWRQLGHDNREAWALDGTGTVYRKLNRLDDAIAFHWRAASIHHDLGDRWYEAVVLDHLATALHEAGNHAEARDSWQQGLALLGNFTDQRAATLRNSIETALADEVDQPQA